MLKNAKTSNGNQTPRLRRIVQRRNNEAGKPYPVARYQIRSMVAQKREIHDRLLMQHLRIRIRLVDARIRILKREIPGFGPKA